jgi:G:T-mismatch repair DNA endonuclease (very short patch repair protein)
MDRKKIKLAESKGYRVLIIWESEFFKNKENAIKKCIDFLESL